MALTYIHPTWDYLGLSWHTDTASCVVTVAVISLYSCVENVLALYHTGKLLIIIIYLCIYVRLHFGFPLFFTHACCSVWNSCLEYWNALSILWKSECYALYTYLDAIVHHFGLFIYYMCSLLECSFCEEYLKIIFVTLVYTLLLCILLIQYVIKVFLYICRNNIHYYIYIMYIYLILYTHTHIYIDTLYLHKI